MRRTREIEEEVEESKEPKKQAIEAQKVPNTAAAASSDTVMMQTE